jgi:hypothetical protein
MARSVEDLKAEHPEWNVVKTIDAPNGGTWAVGADGGVFALDGAPYLKSYNDLPPEARQGGRTFTDIKTNDRGGYTIYDQGNETGYRFEDPAFGKTTTTKTDTPKTDTSVAAASARGSLQEMAKTYGLDAGFIERMYGVWLNTKDMNSVYADMVNDPAYKARFPGMDALRQKGRIISEDAYLAIERQATQTMRYYGLPAGFYDSPDDFGKLIGGEVSPKELEDRIMMAGTAAYSTDPSLRQQLERFGVSSGDLTAYFLDPPTAEEFITRKNVFQEAQIGVGSQRSGFGLLTKDEAARLRDAGLSADQAAAALGQQVGAKDLTAATLDEATGGTAALGRGALISAAAQDKAAQAEIDRRTRSRQARFEGGGGAAGIGRGTSGLG